MREDREYAIECADMGAGVWSPHGLWAREGANDRIVRCRDCRHARERNGRLVCHVRPMTCHVTEPDGFCHRGEPRGGA